MVEIDSNEWKDNVRMFFFFFWMNEWGEEEMKIKHTQMVWPIQNDDQSWLRDLVFCFFVK